MDRNTITNATGILTTPSTRKQLPNKNSARIQAQAYELDIEYDLVMFEEIATMESYEQHMSGMWKRFTKFN